MNNRLQLNLNSRKDSVAKSQSIIGYSLQVKNMKNMDIFDQKPIRPYRYSSIVNF